MTTTTQDSYFAVCEQFQQLIEMANIQGITFLGSQPQRSVGNRVSVERNHSFGVGIYFDNDYAVNSGGASSYATYRIKITNLNNSSTKGKDLGNLALELRRNLNHATIDNGATIAYKQTTCTYNEEDELTAINLYFQLTLTYQL